MAANDLAMTAATTQGTAPSVANSTANSSPAPNNASVANETPGKHEHGEHATDDFGAVLTQLLGATNTPPIAATEVAGQATTDSADAKRVSDAAADANGIQLPTGAGVPWELMLASAGVASREPSLGAIAGSSDAASTKRDAAVGAAAPVALPSAISALLAGATAEPAAQLTRDLQAGSGQDTATADALQSQQGERNTTDGVGLANALSVSALNARQLDPTGEQSHVRAHVGAAAWADELGAKLTWMTERGVQSASLTLSPEHLGPLEIRISVNNDQASVWFGAAHADTRIALEQALPRLRELFASQGLNLADAGVFREPPREQARDYRTANDALGNGNEQEIRIATLRAQGSIDAYA